MSTNPDAGTLVPPSEKLDVAALTRAYYEGKPDPAIAAQRVSFGTSGHRGSAFATSFNEGHILATTEAICRYRKRAGIDGPLFIGRDSHALSEPAFHTALEVLAAHGVAVLADAGGGFTPTPAVSRAIIAHNVNRETGLADGIVITPSHNPPEDGGFKYNPPHGGPAGSEITSAVEKEANTLLEAGLAGVKRATAATTPFDFTGKYVEALAAILDMDAIRGVKIGVDPLGGAAVGYWQPIAERYRLNLTVTDATVDPSFATVPRDWDGKIRMDCSSPYPMKRLLAKAAAFDIAFANDTDADRHGIVDGNGLMPPNDYLATSAHYLGVSRAVFKGRKIGKTIVSSSMIDRVAGLLNTEVYEVPVGFKWFVDPLRDGSVFFAGEESAGSSFLMRDGAVWTTDKDGLIAGLLAAEMTARTGKTPSQLYADITEKVGRSFYARSDNPANAATRKKIAALSPETVTATELAGSPITRKLSKAPGNGAAIGGLKLESREGWIALRPSGTEDIYKIYAESFVSSEHLAALQAAGRDLAAKA
ncbi:MAG: alpha-D-glucose phosphate-specific phosphoglucomutase [Alphaproteobacteria bacterium]|nr:alpha-D-glucose phosphate-specific phosphoglucomutase [Alphaproteobacteria bacterium]